ncbi:MAG TPA: histidine kinase dimerization/phospho-acceptor domain-containing protein [Chloroflexota bacterium]|nr:histidine kinase dimerization/phospho-acceptor domain-containing protein [Chloroflexota bacterium]
MPEANGRRADGPVEQSAPARFWYQVVGPSLRGPQFLLESEAARHIEGFLNQARVVLIGCLLVLANTGLLPAAGEELTLLLAAAGFVWATSVALLVHFFYRPWVAIAIALLDVLWVSGLIYLTGGPRSSLDGLYAIVIFAAIIRFTKVHSFLFTAAVILGYVEVVSRHPGFSPFLHGNQLLVRATVLAAAGMLAWFISVEVERQRRAVVEVRQELASLAMIDLLSRRLGLAADRDQVTRAVLALAEQLAPGSALALAMLGPHGRLSLAGVGGTWPRARGQPWEPRLERSEWPLAAETGDQRSVDPLDRALRAEGFGQILALPLGSGSSPSGRLYAGTVRPLRDADRAVLQRLADDAGLALQRIDLLERERDRATAMGRLAEQNGLLLEQERDTVTRLRQLAMHKDDFIMMLAHELRTPLTSIRGFAQLLVRAATGRSESLTYPEVILDRANRMVEIIDDIVDLSRMERDLLELERQPLDPAELVEKVRRAAARRVHITVERPAELPPVKADADKLYRALLALVERAAKYQRAEAPLRLTLERDDAELQLWLEVDGEVPTQRLATIFEETPVASDEPHGGLGLYICKTMVEAHGGRLWLERSGSGSRFGVRLPIDATARLPRLPPDQRLTV